MVREDQLQAFLSLVDEVTAAGAQPSAEFTALRQRLDDVLNLNGKTPMRDLLTTAVLDDEPGPGIDMLWALSLAETADQHATAGVTTSIRHAAHQRLRQLYDAPDAYRQIADRFDKAATDFTAAAQLADPETDPTVVITQPDKARKAWLAAESHANQLSRLIDPLAAAASLAGVRDTDLDTTRLPLCVNVDGAHRRKLWLAWIKRAGDGRCGRWSALHALGVTIRAADDLGNLEAYREPAAMETREEAVRDENGRVVATRRVPHDPEDDDFAPAPIDPIRRGRSVQV